MQVLTTETALQSRLADRGAEDRVGFVPTMGALHRGHISLINRSIEENAVTVCSIFVNPTQFNDPRDFERYPRRPEEDADMLERAGCDVLFSPSHETIYPKPDAHTYELGDVAGRLEGKFRPGHFNGVASVVKRFLELVKPDRAYFGLKDYQQFLVVKSLAARYKIPTEIIGCETVREENGLALSSRNKLLSAKDQQLALRLYGSLVAAKEAVKYGRHSGLKSIGEACFSGPDAPRLEYFEIADGDDLTPIGDGDISNAVHPVALVAAHVNGVRLIDNMVLK